MTPCENHLRTRLKTDQWLSIAEFMKTALHDPHYGYYSQQHVIGSQNDFITAPEVSQFFGESLGFWLLNIWEKLGRPSPFILLELGPGRGTLLADLLRLTSQRPDFIQGIYLYLVDINPHLKAHQEKQLSAYSPQWFEALSSALKAAQGLPLFVIANEFLDVFPIHQYMRTSTGWHERGIAIDTTESLTYSLTKNPPEINPSFFPSEAKEGDIFETCPEAEQVVREISQYLTQHQGGALFIDYGYKEGTGDTFQALYQHHYISPLEHLGEADLTAHVHFGALLNLLDHFPSLHKNLSSQGDFLKVCGIEPWAHKVMQKASPQQCEIINHALHRLLSPHQMGTLFKVLEVYSAC
ncbi:MAG: SAM-dependent methyltransferase [Candidatus Paracaedimonas acanthamoebae]|uniref:SAM-dependent methyltransferase n=1 Tax=Candidatus Paracaedimonas acanthamoebae TaxID=244581 RepID=A0A8J7TVE5_9PROT|nr:SAM-dependent methyltransferase [Candidatus Paracaedimonas acanthamoebae]